MSKCPYRLCYFTWSHDQMLLRRRNEDDTNDDIFFEGIDYIEIPTMFDEVEVEKPTASDLEYLKTRTEVDNKQVTVLKINEKRYYVVSVSVKTEHNFLDVNEVSFFVGFVPVNPDDSEDMDLFFDMFMEGYDRFKHSEDYIPTKDKEDNIKIYAKYGSVFARMKDKEHRLKLVSLLSDPRDAFYLSMAMEKLCSARIPEMEPLLLRYLNSDDITDAELGIKDGAEYYFSGHFIRKNLKLSAMAGIKYYPSAKNIELLKKYENDEDVFIRNRARKSIAYMSIKK